MDFAELVTETQLWLKRPDMDGAVRSALRAATLKYHRKEKFWRDRKTVSVAPAAQLDIATTFPQFRQLASVSGAVIVDADYLLDRDGYELQNIAFLAGTSLNLKLTPWPESIAVTYYVDPVVSPEPQYSSWIADQQPDLLIAAAVAKCMSFAAESDIYKAAKVEEQSQWVELLQNNIESVGR